MRFHIFNSGAYAGIVRPGIDMGWANYVMGRLHVLYMHIFNTKLATHGSFSAIGPEQLYSLSTTRAHVPDLVILMIIR